MTGSRHRPAVDQDSDAGGKLREKNGDAILYDPAKPHRALGIPGKIGYTHGPNGNQSIRTAFPANATMTYGFDALDRLISVDTGGQTKTFGYDPSDHRVWKTRPDGTTVRYFSQYAESRDGQLVKFYWAGERLIASITTAGVDFSELPPGVPHPSPPWLPLVLLGAFGTALVLIVVAPGSGERRIGVLVAPARAAGMGALLLLTSTPMLLASDCGGGPVLRHFHLDQLGSIVARTDETGALVRQVRYSAYGELRGHYNAAAGGVAASDADRYEWTGYETEADIDYAGARWYDPAIGQFLSLDPARQYASPYAYGPGDPMNGVDPNGMSFFGDVWGGIQSAWKGFKSVLRAGGNAIDGLDGRGGIGIGSVSVGVSRSFGGGGRRGGDGSPGDADTANVSRAHRDALTVNGLESSYAVHATIIAVSAALAATGSEAETQGLVTKFDRFFETHYDAAAVMAAEYGVDATLVLAVAAKESDWGTSPMAREHNNPFGFTPGGQGSRPVHFDSVFDAWQAWGRQWGPRVYNVESNVERFVNNLQTDNRFIYGPTIGGDRRGRYNTESMATWGPSIPAIVRSVQARLAQWSGYGP